MATFISFFLKPLSLIRFESLQRYSLESILLGISVNLTDKLRPFQVVQQTIIVHITSLKRSLTLISQVLETLSILIDCLIQGLVMLGIPVCEVLCWTGLNAKDLLIS